jgi:CMP-N,N'-diacetyllegionaminic acid synthase
MKKILVVIPARGGSKRLPRKNILKLNDKPLIQYPIELAKALPGVGKICVSTDDQEIADLAISLGAEVPYLRPADISGDLVPLEKVVQNVYEYYQKSFAPDILLTLTPATPLTNIKYLVEGLQAIHNNSEINSVITVREATEHAEWILRVDKNGNGNTILGNPLNGKFNTSQNLEKFWYLMGAFFINRVSAFKNQNSMYSEPFYCIKMNQEENVDIDTPEDFKKAIEVLNRK